MRSALESLNNVINRLSSVLHALAMVFMMIMAVHVTLSVSTRIITGAEIAGTLEFTTYYYMPMLAFLALPYVDKHGGHIRADLIGALVTGRSSQLLEGITRLCLAIFFALIAWRAFDVAVARTLMNELTRSASGYIPIWPGRWALAAAATLAALHSIVAAARSFIGVDIDSAAPSQDEAGATVE